MEQRKNTNDDEVIYPCKNKYTSETFFESFGQDDVDMRNCNNCPNLNYECGMMTCKKFNK